MAEQRSIASERRAARMTPRDAWIRAKSEYGEKLAKIGGAILGLSCALLQIEPDPPPLRPADTKDSPEMFQFCADILKWGARGNNRERLTKLMEGVQPDIEELDRDLEEKELAMMHWLLVQARRGWKKYGDSGKRASIEAGFQLYFSGLMDIKPEARALFVMACAAMPVEET